MAADRRAIGRQFTAGAAGYARQAQVQQQVIDDLLTWLPQEIPPGPVCDIGCGPGDLLHKLAAALPGRPLWGCDLAPTMCRLAQQRVPRAHILTADAHALPLRESRFALVVSTSVFQWSDALLQAFAEAWRLLCPGGIFACSLFLQGTLGELRQAQTALTRTPSLLPPPVPLPAWEEVRQAMMAHPWEVLFRRTWQAQERHPDLPALLRHLRQTGTGNPQRSRRLWTPADLRALADAYPRDGAPGLVASYQVGSFCLRRSAAGGREEK